MGDVAGTTTAVAGTTTAVAAGTTTAVVGTTPAGGGRVRWFARMGRLRRRLFARRREAIRSLFTVAAAARNTKNVDVWAQSLSPLKSRKPRRSATRSLLAGAAIITTGAAGD